MRLTSSTFYRDWLIDLATLTVVLLIFYTFWLGSYPLFTPDEGRYSEIAREMVATGDFITPRVNGIAFFDKPILYYWLQAIAIYLFGVKEWALRLFPALLGILGCLSTYVCGRFLFDRRTALLSAIILSTTPLYFACAHYADLDLEVAVFISCSLLFFITATQLTSSLRHYFLYAAYLSAAFAFLTKGLIGIAFPGMIVGCWILLLNRWSILTKIHLLTGLLLFAAVVVPWYVFVEKANPGFLHYFFVTQQVTRFLSTGEFNNKTPIWFYLPIVLAGFFPWTIFLFQALYKQIRRVWQTPQQHANELFLLLWIMIIFGFFSIPHSKIIGYILPIFPALALLVGHYLSSIWETASRFAIFLFIACSILLASILLVLPHYQWIDLATSLTPFLKAIAFIFIISAVSAVILLKQKNRQAFFILCTTCNVIFLLLLLASAPHLNQNSAKSLVQELKPIIKPQDEVITYFKYYQDVPLYLGQLVVIAANWQAPDIAYKDNWQRELWYGMPFQKTDQLINEDEFWKRWDSDNRVFVFLNDNYFNQFKLRAKSYFFLGKSNDIILLSNKPTVLAQNPQHSLIS